KDCAQRALDDRRVVDSARRYRAIHQAELAAVFHRPDHGQGVADERPPWTEQRPELRGYALRIHRALRRWTPGREEQLSHDAGLIGARLTRERPRRERRRGEKV